MKAKHIIRPAIAVLLVIAAVIAVRKTSIGIKGLFGTTYTETASIVEQTRRLARITTARYNEEAVVPCRRYQMISAMDPKSGRPKQVKDWAPPTPFDNISYSKRDTIVFFDKSAGDFRMENDRYNIYYSTGFDEVCYMMTARVRAGYDLSGMREEDLRVSGDTLFVSLPPEEVFEVSINPSDITVFSQKGHFTFKEEQQILSREKAIILNRALEAGILDTARKGGEDLLFRMFSSFGYGHVVLIHDQDSAMSSRHSISSAARRD